MNEQLHGASKEANEDRQKQKGVYVVREIIYDFAWIQKYMSAANDQIRRWTYNGTQASYPQVIRQQIFAYLKRVLSSAHTEAEKDILSQALSLDSSALDSSALDSTASSGLSPEEEGLQTSSLSEPLLSEPLLSEHQIKDGNNKKNKNKNKKSGNGENTVGEDDVAERLPSAASLEKIIGAYLFEGATLKDLRAVFGSVEGCIEKSLNDTKDKWGEGTDFFIPNASETLEYPTGIQGEDEAELYIDMNGDAKDEKPEGSLRFLGAYSEQQNYNETTDISDLSISVLREAIERTYGNELDEFVDMWKTLTQGREADNPLDIVRFIRLVHQFQLSSGYGEKLQTLVFLEMEQAILQDLGVVVFEAKNKLVEFGIPARDKIEDIIMKRKKVFGTTDEKAQAVNDEALFQSLLDLLQGWEPKSLDDIISPQKEAGDDESDHLRPLNSQEVFSAIATLQQWAPKVLEEALGQSQGVISKHIKESLVKQAETLGIPPGKAKMSEEDEKAVNLVDEVFTQNLYHRQMQQAARTILAQILFPSVKAAILNRRWFSEERHPARQFLISVADACAPENGPVNHEALANAEKAVDKLVAGFNEDVSIFETLTQEVKAFSEKKETSSVSKEETSVRARIYKELQDKWTWWKGPAPVMDFVLKLGAEYLAKLELNKEKGSVKWSSSVDALERTLRLRSEKDKRVRIDGGLRDNLIRMLMACGWSGVRAHNILAEQEDVIDAYYVHGKRDFSTLNSEMSSILTALENSDGGIGPQIITGILQAISPSDDHQEGRMGLSNKNTSPMDDLPDVLFDDTQIPEQPLFPKKDFDFDVDSNRKKEGLNEIKQEEVDGGKTYSSESDSNDPDFEVKGRKNKKDTRADKKKFEKAETERLEKERLEAERLEAERLEQERLEQERLEEKRLEAERLEAERLEQERLEQERLEEKRLEAERLEAERLEQERLEQERLEAERLEQERLEQERLEEELLEAERLAQERKEQERLDAERLEAERLERERLEFERLEEERLEQERLEEERLEKERLEEEDQKNALEQATPVGPEIYNETIYEQPLDQRLLDELSYVEIDESLKKMKLGSYSIWITNTGDLCAVRLFQVHAVSKRYLFINDDNEKVMMGTLHQLQLMVNDGKFFPDQ